MDLVRHVRFFVVIAEERHFGRAAARLGMSQPPLSQGLRRLETHLGARLFDRDAREVVLTAAGEDLLEHARGLLAGVARLEEAAADHVAPGRVLRIGLAGPLRPQVAASLVSAVRRWEPGTRAEIVPGGTTTLTERVAADRLDVAVVRHPAVVAAVDAGPVVRVPTRLLVPAGPTRATGLRWGSLRGLAFAAPPRAWHPAAHDMLIDTLSRRGLDPRVLAIDDDVALLAAVAGGQAFAVTADPALDGPGVTAYAPSGDPLPLRFRPVWSRARRPPEGLVDTVTEALRAEAAR